MVKSRFLIANATIDTNAMSARACEQEKGVSFVLHDGNFELMKYRFLDGTRLDQEIVKNAACQNPPKLQCD
jgi:hypothetical protein